MDVPGVERENRQAVTGRCVERPPSKARSGGRCRRTALQHHASPSQPCSAGRQRHAGRQDRQHPATQSARQCSQPARCRCRWPVSGAMTSATAVKPPATARMSARVGGGQDEQRQPSAHRSALARLGTRRPNSPLTRPAGMAIYRMETICTIGISRKRAENAVSDAPARRDQCWPLDRASPKPATPVGGRSRVDKARPLGPCSLADKGIGRASSCRLRNTRTRSRRS